MADRLANQSPRGLPGIAFACWLASACSGAHADDAKAEAQPDSAAASPWLLVPTLQSNPKLGTAAGGMAGYLHKFDPKSQVSIFAVSLQYTSTESATAGLIARTSFSEDHQRLNVIAVGGRIRNDYDDYLGTGTPLNSEDNLHAFGGRYLYRAVGDWFVGAQLVATNYQIVGQTALDDDLLGLLGLTGFESGGAGLVVLHDSRDRTDSPSRGWMFNFNNVAYRDSIYGSANFDVYRADYRHFWNHGDGHVFALRQNNQWTVDAPPGALAPINLRGYTMGEYLGESMSSIEVEERHRIAERWTATAFVGVACLYGGARSCGHSSDQYPSLGAGIQYVLKPVQGIVANLEGAFGKEGNKALLFKLGYGW
jgi:hypothetical protein